jgi:hypothetical protein
MALLSKQSLVYSSGAVPTLAAASTSDTVTDFGNGTTHFLWYKNTDANTKTLTVIPSGATPYGVAYSNLVYTLTSSTGQLMIPLHPGMADSTGTITVALTGTGGATGVTVALVRTP